MEQDMYQTNNELSLGEQHGVRLSRQVELSLYLQCSNFYYKDISMYYLGSHYKFLDQVHH